MISQDIQGRIENLKEQLMAKYPPEKVILFASSAPEPDIIHAVAMLIVKEDVPVLGAEKDSPVVPEDEHCSAG